ncbi:hypothetical protein PAPHI01_2374 [Pancytospora philotis]|nr:hypothetical protein PAPHI01_2374 [Pancytospora philotis]
MVRLDYSEERDILSRIIAHVELTCDVCGNWARLDTNRDSILVRCSKRLCNYGRSFWKGTLFEDTNAPREQALGILDL